MPDRSARRISATRRWMNSAMLTLAVASAIAVLVPLLAIFAYLVLKGASSLSWSFLVNRPAPPGEAGGGIGNGIVGSGFMLAIGSLLGIPVGLGAGTYVAEYGGGRLSQIVRFTADLLNGVPSIVVGMAVYGMVVVPQRHFSALAGGVAFGIMMVPTIARSTEEMLLMVPRMVREAALGLGIPRWRATVSVTLRTALPGIITGIMLAFARVAGETAPLMFTAFGNQFWNWNPNQPTAALPLQIFSYAISPFEDWHRQAWGGALVLIVLIVGTVAIVRLFARRGVFEGTQ